MSATIDGDGNVGFAPASSSEKAASASRPVDSSSARSVSPTFLAVAFARRRRAAETPSDPAQPHPLHAPPVAQTDRIPGPPRPTTSGHSWRFKARFRRHAFGWKSQPAIVRLHEAVSEITLVARIDPMIGAEGAVALLKRVSPALENVDSSSGAIGTAVNQTIAELVPLIVAAPADANTRDAWLERLFDAHSADQIPWGIRGEHHRAGSRTPLTRSVAAGSSV